MSIPKDGGHEHRSGEAFRNAPEDWSAVRLRYLLRNGYEGLKIGPFGSQLTSEMLMDGGPYKVYGQENVIASDFIRGDRYISEAKFDELSVYEVTPGDLLITMMGTSGRCEVVPGDAVQGIMDSHLLRMRLNPSALAEFVRLLIDEAPYVALQVQVAGKGSIMHGLNSSIVKNLCLLVPPMGVQRQVLQFLDRETAKIDALVAEQQRLIELLKEKRQAVISQAVTKGLDPNVPMKDSGVEWLGKVPAHWNLKRVKRLVSSFEQGWSPQCDGYAVDSDQQWGVLKVGCVNGGTFRPEENKALPLDLEPQPDLGVRAGDLLISRANTRDLVGGAAVVDRDYANLLLCDKLYRLRFARRACTPRFIGLYLGTSGVRGQIELAATGASSSMVNIGQSTILELNVTLPDLAEQEAITAHLDRVCLQIDALTEEAQSATALLQERRSALISAAVTGKIDVRCLVQQTEAVAA